MKLLAKSPVAALTWLLLLPACDAPVDCAREPQRCPHVAAPSPVTQQTPPRAQPPVPETAARQLVHLPQKVLAEVAPMPAGAPTRDEVQAMVATVQLPAKAKRFDGLKPFITQRLYDTLGPLLAQDNARLWRHLDKYVKAADGGFRTEVESVEADRVQLHLTLPSGEELRPIVLKQNGVWKIDRF